MTVTNLAIAVLLVLIVPGFLTQAVISSSITRQQRVGQIWVAEVAGFGLISAVLFVLVYTLVSWLFGQPEPDLANFVTAQTPFLIIAIPYAVFCILVPIALGFGLIALFQRGYLQALYQALGVPYQHPTPRAWDWYFSERRQRIVVVTMLDGSKIAGFFGLGSRAATYPANEDIFLEIVYPLNNGIIGQKPVQNSGGTWIQGSQIRLIEFYAPLE